MAERSSAQTIDDYIAEFPESTQAVLQQVRELIHATAPDAVETIAYAIPTFDLKKKHLVHFAAFTKHIGFYPTPSGIDEFKKDLAPYATAKGTAQFPLSEPIPTDLIRRIVEFRVSEVTKKASA